MENETKDKKWSVGRRIAVGLKWMAIMGVIITIFAFVQFVMKFQAGYYDLENIEEWLHGREI